MSGFLNTYSTYNERKDEIRNFIKFMESLEELESENGNNSLINTFLLQNSMNYQTLINILKSNLSLMIYNIIEFSVSNLLDGLYTKIFAQRLTYDDVSKELKNLWHEAQYRGSRDPNASFNTFINKSKYIVDWITGKKPLQKISPKNTMPGGNLDGTALEKVFKSHGIEINSKSPNYRPDIFNNIKINRNNLAHGSFSFSDALKDSSISDLKKKSEFVLNFIDELVITVKEYAEKESYKHQ